jgi:hypothetical protein
MTKTVGTSRAQPEMAEHSGGVRVGYRFIAVVPVLAYMREGIREGARFQQRLKAPASMIFRFLREVEGNAATRFDAIHPRWNHC